MPGATPVFGLPYPLESEPIDPAAFQNLADAVDALMDSHEAVVADQLDRPFCSLSIPGGQSITVNVETSATWTEIIDSDNFFNPGTPTDIVYPIDGIYQVVESNMTLSSFATLTSFRVHYWSNGASLFGERKNETNSSSAPPTSTIGLIRALAGEVLTVRILWTGTGGPAALFNGLLQVRFVCPLT